MTPDLEGIRRRWEDPELAPGGRIAYEDVNDLLEHVQELARQVTDARIDARLARNTMDVLNKGIDTERQLRDEYKDRVALRDAVLRAIWDGSHDPAVRTVLEAWYHREAADGR